MARVLQLTDVETATDPTRVLLIAANDATDNDTVKTSARSSSALRGNVGDKNYDISQASISAGTAPVTIWCNRFNVNFGTAR